MDIRFLRQLGILFAVTAILLLIGSVRMSQRGHWLPASPQEIGCWTATETPIPPSTEALLGSPPSYGRRFTDPFNERVEYHVIATTSYMAYHKPALLTPGFGYTMTAVKQIPMFGKDNQVRAMILKNDRDGQRILMYYWTQYQDGSTSVRDYSADNNEAVGRIAAGFFGVVDKSQSCLVRAYILIHPADPLGLMARRNLNEICNALYKSFKEDGARS